MSGVVHISTSYFPTRMGPVHRNLGDRNFAKELTDALHARKIKVVGYYSFIDLEAWNANPDWRQKDLQGADIAGGNFGSLCPNSPYRESLVARVLEIVETFDLDGMVLPDSMHFSGRGCYCDYCREKFRDQYGRSLPEFTGDYSTDWHEFLRWRYNCIREVFFELSRAVRQRKPEMALSQQAFDLRGDSWRSGDNCEESTQYDDIVCSIASWSSFPGSNEVRRNPALLWKTGFLTKYLRAISGRPVNMHFGRFCYDREFQTIPEHEMRLGAYSVLINGGIPSIADNLYPDGTIEEVAYERVGAVHREIKESEEYLRDRIEVPVVGLYYSKLCNDYLDTVSSGEFRYLHSFEGAYRLLLESHIPCQIVSGRSVTAKQLAPFKTLIVPNAVLMEEREVELIKDYVRGGGAVVCTAQTSLMDGIGRRRPDFGLGDLLEVSFESTLNNRLSYIAALDAALSPDIELREPLIMRDNQVKVLPLHGARIGGQIVYPATGYYPRYRAFTFASDVPREDKSDFPACVMAESAKGRCVYFAGDVTRIYGEYGYLHLRLMVRNAIRWCCRNDLPIEVQAPLNVEVGWFRQDGRDLIQLLNYTADGLLRGTYEKGGSFATAPIRCGEITITMDTGGRKPRRVVATSTGDELPSAGAGKTTFTLPGLDTHEIIAVEY